jgi:hypothetical protein
MQSIMRIMSLVISVVPLKGLDPSVSLNILNIATSQGFYAIQSSNFLL